MFYPAHTGNPHIQSRLSSTIFKQQANLLKRLWYIRRKIRSSGFRPQTEIQGVAEVVFLEVLTVILIGELA